jgi:predicted transcriptional regulator
MRQLGYYALQPELTPFKNMVSILQSISDSAIRPTRAEFMRASNIPINTAYFGLSGQLFRYRPAI